MKAFLISAALVAVSGIAQATPNSDWCNRTNMMIQNHHAVSKEDRELYRQCEEAYKRQREAEAAMRGAKPVNIAATSLSNPTTSGKGFSAEEVKEGAILCLIGREQKFAPPICKDPTSLPTAMRSGLSVDGENQVKLLCFMIKARRVNQVQLCNHPRFAVQTG